MDIKKVLKVLLIIGALCSIGVVSASADTTRYYFNLGGGQTDMTKRTLKAGGSSYASAYYVRPTKFSRKQNYKVEPHRIVTETRRPAVGSWRTIYYKNKNVLGTYSYNKGSCPANYYYYLFACFVDG